MLQNLVDIGRVTQQYLIHFFLFYWVLEAAFLEHFLLNTEKLVESSGMTVISFQCLGKKRMTVSDRMGLIYRPHIQMRSWVNLIIQLDKMLCRKDHQ